MREEVRFHLDARAAHLVKQGMSPADAVRRARLEFGNPVAWQDQCRDARGLRLLAELAQDIRFAIRGFARQKTLAAIVIATLTFGIGVSSGVFTLLDAVALRARVDDPASFVRVYTAATTDRARPGRPGEATVEEYAAFRERAPALRALSAYHRYGAAIGPDDAQSRTLLVTCDFFDVFGVTRALAGRLLRAGDCDGAAPVVVLSESLWQTRFNGDPGIVGSSITVNRLPLVVVGIAPRSNAQVDNSETWIPYRLRANLGLGADPSHRVNGRLPQERWLALAGRLAPSAGRDTVAAELSVIAGQEDRLETGRMSSVLVTDGALISDPSFHATVLSLVTLVMGALSCLVLVACANVATLLLSRADARHQEIAVRLSLGAGRGRLARMLLTEILLLAGCAGIAGVYVACQVPVLITHWLIGAPPPFSLALDWRVFTYLAGATAVAGIVAGMAPALEALRVDVLDSLKGRRSILGVAGGTRVRAALITIQVSLSFVLLVGAGLFVITHYRIATEEPGFDSRQVLLPRVTPRDSRSGAPAVIDPAAYIEALSGVPGVQRIAFARVPPMTEAPATLISTGGLAPRPIATNEVSAGYFDAVGLRILRGRALDDGDAPCARRTCHVVVSESFAHQVLGGGEPLGRMLRGETGAALEVVGVAQDASVQQLGRPDPPALYLPWNRASGPHQPVVRFAGDGDEISVTAAAVLRRRFPGMNVDARTARWYVNAWLEEVGRLEILIVTLGASAAALAVMGVFGVVSFAVGRRTREIGVRIALGATPADIYAIVIGGGVRPVVVGLVSGAVIAVLTAIGFARLLEKFRFAVSPTAPLTYAVVTLLLGAIILAALAVPARRAARVNPLAALRDVG
jgi:predicted permease